MANTFTDGVYVVDTVGVLTQRTGKPTLDPIHITSIVYTGTGTATIKDNQDTANTLLTLTVAAGSVVVPLNRSFPHGLQVSAISGGTLFFFIK